MVSSVSKKGKLQTPLKNIVPTPQSVRKGSTAQKNGFEKKLQNHTAMTSARRVSFGDGEGSKDEEDLGKGQLLASYSPKKKDTYNSVASVKKKNMNPGLRIIGGRIYDSENGQSCHQCRQKTLEIKAPCKKERCSMMFCPKCLLNRYGEHVAEVCEIPGWMCPKCRGICNCSQCRKKNGLVATGIMAHAAKATGMKSVAELLDVLPAMNSVPRLQEVSPNRTPVRSPLLAAVQSISGSPLSKQSPPLQNNGRNGSPASVPKKTPAKKEADNTPSPLTTRPPVAAVAANEIPTQAKKKLHSTPKSGKKTPKAAVVPAINTSELLRQDQTVKVSPLKRGRKLPRVSNGAMSPAGPSLTGAPGKMNHLKLEVKMEAALDVGDLPMSTPSKSRLNRECLEMDLPIPDTLEFQAQCGTTPTKKSHKSPVSSVAGGVNAALTPKSLPKVPGDGSLKKQVERRLSNLGPSKVEDSMTIQASNKEEPLAKAISKKKSKKQKLFVEEAKDGDIALPLIGQKRSPIFQDIGEPCHMPKKQKKAKPAVPKVLGPKEKAALVGQTLNNLLGKINNSNEIKTAPLQAPRVELPIGQEVEIEGIELTPDALGDMFQIREFLTTFSELLKLRHGYVEVMLWELSNAKARSALAKTDIIHCKLLNLIRKDVEMSKVDKSNMWYKAMIEHLKHHPHPPPGWTCPVLTSDGEDSGDDSGAKQRAARAAARAQRVPLKVADDVTRVCKHLTRGPDGYLKLPLSQKLALLRLLCDDLIETDMFREHMDWIVEELEEKQKANRSQLTAAKKEAREELQKLKAEQLQKLIAHTVNSDGAESESIVLTLEQQREFVQQSTADAERRIAASKQAVTNAELMLNEGMGSGKLQTQHWGRDGSGLTFWKLKDFDGTTQILSQALHWHSDGKVAETWLSYCSDDEKTIAAYITFAMQEEERKAKEKKKRGRPPASPSLVLLSANPAGPQEDGDSPSSPSTSVHALVSPPSNPECYLSPPNNRDGDTEVKARGGSPHAPTPPSASTSGDQLSTPPSSPKCYMKPPSP